MAKRPNIILLTIDSLRFDRLGINNYSPAITPNLDRIFNTGLKFDKVFAHGCPTQFSFPSFFTSTLPLDDGGYDRGIIDREYSFVEVLKENGYRTIGYSIGGSLTSYYGYKRGFDEYYHLQDITLLPLTFWKSYLRHHNDLYTSSAISFSEFVDSISDYLYRLIVSMSELCIEKHEEVRNKELFYSSRMHWRNFKKLHSYFVEQEKIYISNPQNTNRH